MRSFRFPPPPPLGDDELETDPNQPSKRGWLKLLLAGGVAFLLFRGGCSPVSVSEKPTGRWAVSLPDDTSPSNPNLVVRVEREFTKHVSVLYAIRTNEPVNRGVGGVEVVAKCQGQEKSYRTDGGGNVNVRLVEDFGLTAFVSDDPLPVEIVVPEANYQSTHEIKASRFLYAIHHFATGELWSADGQTHEGETDPNVDYAVIEKPNENDYKVRLTDGSERLVRAATSPVVVAYAANAEGASPEVAMASRATDATMARGDALPVAAPSVARGFGKTYALLVAVGDYDNFGDLANPIPDAIAVEKELCETYGVETTLLKNPSRNAFRSMLYDLADKKYGKNDQLLVYFSGHGWFDERLKRGFLALKDSKPLNQDSLRDSLVPHEDVRTVLERLDCRHVLLVVDSCFSGTLDPTLAMASDRQLQDVYEPVPRAEYVRRKLAYQTRRYITAGGKEYVSDGRPGAHSPFTRQLLAGLRTYGGSDAILTLEELLLHLDRVNPQPRSGELLGNEPGSSFVLTAQPLTDASPNAAVTQTELTVVATPSDAQVTVLPLDSATEPLRAMRVQAATGTQTFRVPTGKYRVRATRDGYRPATVDVAASSARQTVTVTMQRN